MKFRHKLLLLMGLYIFGISAVMTFSLYGWSRTRDIQESISLGQDLQIQSREVQSLMKDIVFDLFAPRIYGQLRSLTYSPRSAVTLRQWSEAVFEYKGLFRQFMGLDFFRQAEDEFIKDQYLTAITMNERAMTMLSRMEEMLTLLRDQYRTVDNLYNTMQKDESLIPFFNEFQETSFYFTNNFESFMDYFIKTLREEGVRVQRRLTFLFLILSLAIGALYLVFTLLLIRSLRVRLSLMESGFQRLSHGDFSHGMPVRGRDEFAYLSQRFNELTAELKENIDSILNLTRDVANRISEEGDLDGLMKLIVRSVVQDTQSSSAVIFTFSEAGEYLPHKCAGITLEDERLPVLADYLADRIFRAGTHLFIRDIREKQELRRFDSSGISTSLMAVPLLAEGKPFGILAAMKNGPEPFSDLGVTRFVTFGEYASLTIDSFIKYRELVERREARYQALQSQVKPHFLYNVLGSIIGLNRMGDREALEKAVLALKQMMRYIQDSAPEATLEEEFTLVEQYLYLQKIRFGQRLEYEIELESEARHVQIPRLLLQPYVENAVLHGIEPLEGPGRILVKAAAVRRRGGRGALITIKDNGIGFDPGEVEGRENIGLNNGRQRFNLAFPEGRLEIAGHREGGTEVIMEL